MFSSRDAFENDFCPVRDELLGEMYRANANGLPMLVDSVSSEVRAMLALFCYRRSHLHSLALAIAASCTERELVQFGGRVGSTLYALSREPAARSALHVIRQRPQADHALDQTALDLQADRGRGRRRGFCRSGDGVSASVVLANAGTIRRGRGYWHAGRRLRTTRATGPSTGDARAASAPSRIRHRRACRCGRHPAAPHRSGTPSLRRPCLTAPNSGRRRSACPTVFR